MSIKTTLEQARNLIADPSKWTQQFYARDELGRYVTARAPAAVCWCSIGAIQNVTNDDNDWFAAEAFLEKFTVSSVSNFNDSHTHEEVLAAFDKAIENAD